PTPGHPPPIGSRAGPTDGVHILELRDKAAAGKFGDAISAEVSRGRALGYYIERRESGAPGTFQAKTRESFIRPCLARLPGQLVRKSVNSTTLDNTASRRHHSRPMMLACVGSNSTKLLVPAPSDLDAWSRYMVTRRLMMEWYGAELARRETGEAKQVVSI